MSEREGERRHQDALFASRDAYYERGETRDGNSCPRALRSPHSGRGALYLSLNCVLTCMCVKLYTCVGIQRTYRCVVSVGPDYRSKRGLMRMRASGGFLREDTRGGPSGKRKG